MDRAFGFGVFRDGNGEGRTSKTCGQAKVIDPVSDKFLHKQGGPKAVQVR
jgi:hypothetical protein